VKICWRGWSAVAEESIDEERVIVLVVGFEYERDGGGEVDRGRGSLLI
jgi:hypothetical protein